MGYDCPVCSTPQADARHLANHLAFTALVHGEAHEAWLDDHCPGWEAEGEAELAERAAGLAEQSEYPQVFEDTTGDGDGRRDYEREHEHDHGHEHAGGAVAGRGSVPGTDAEVEAALEAARELTRERLEE